jgi:hyperosmotically inducible protein
MKTWANVAAGVLVSIALLGAAGCADSNRRGPGEAGAVASDSWITTKVKSKLAADKAASVTKIHVKTVDGVVTLTGKANSKDDAERAVQEATNIQGVKSVVNNIDVGS